MRISCQIIEDLLPLYVDGVCQEDTKAFMKEHLQTCVKCSVALDQMKQDEFKVIKSVNIEEAQVQTLQSLRQKFMKNKITLILLSVFSAIGICIGGYFLIFRLEVPIQYNERLIGVQAIEDRMMEFKFLEDDFYRCHHLQRTVEIDGQMKNILMIYYTNTIWTKLSPKQQFISDSENLFTVEEHQNLSGWTEANWETVYINGKIDAVYYMVANYNHLFDKPLDSVLEKATLLWERE